MSARPHLAWFVPATLVLFSSLPTDRAIAFSSFPPGAPHDVVTAAAAGPLGVGARAVNAWTHAVRDVDWVESDAVFIPAGRFPFRPNANYVFNHHFDRPPGFTSAGAFTSARAYMLSERNTVIAQGNAGRWANALVSLGHTLHALEDFYAHSNYSVLTLAQQTQCDTALFNTTKNPAAALQLTGYYDPGYRATNVDPGSPPGDPYPHTANAKDDATYNAVASAGTPTNFAIASAAAAVAGTRMLREIAAALGGVLPSGPDETVRIGSGDLSAAGRARPRAVQLAPPSAWDLFASYVPDPDPTDALFDWLVTSPCGPSGCTVSGPGTVLTVPSGSFAAPETVTVLGVPGGQFDNTQAATAADGALLVLAREFRVTGDGFHVPAAAHLSFSPTEVATLMPASVGVYHYVPVDAGGTWLPLAGSSADALGGTADFPVATAGGYAIGGQIDQATPVLADEADVSADPDAVRLTWYVGGDAASARVERRVPGEGWTLLATVTTDGTHRVVYQDDHITPGADYEYRLELNLGNQWLESSVTSVHVPMLPRLSLEGARPNPGVRQLVVSFTLPDDGPSRLQVLDPLGRLVYAREVSGLGAGRHVLDVSDARSMPAGVYLLRLTWGHTELRARAVVIR